jgi:hypothetical protein
MRAWSRSKDGGSSEYDRDVAKRRSDSNKAKRVKISGNYCRYDDSGWRDGKRGSCSVVPWISSNRLACVTISIQSRLL